MVCFFICTPRPACSHFFFFNDPAPPEISPLSPPDALPTPLTPIKNRPEGRWSCVAHQPHKRRYCKDRKSTRLNSSHLVISYAVFCLKKKIGNGYSVLPPVYHDTISRALHGTPGVTIIARPQ